MNNRYEFMFFIEAINCNPNGDPDMGNTPRIDPETMHGIITDTAIKRRIRNYIEDVYNHEYGMDIIKREKSNMNKTIAELAFEANKGPVLKTTNKKVEEASVLACKKYYDVRTFGDVLNTGVNAGQIRGPVQFAMAMSVDPILPLDMSITRVCYTEGEFDSLEKYDELDEKMEDSKKRTMGRKQVIPYGLYVVRGSVSANLAEKTGFTEKDLNILFEAIMQSYNNDISASKTGMSVLQPMFIFKHIGTNPSNVEQIVKETKLGCAPAYKLFELISIKKKDNVEYPRDYKDYNVTVDLDNIPNGVQIGFKYGPFDDIIWDNLAKTENWINS